jgi:bifunctional DNA-binding transcriptional regulator/antitoxin component of YhaV-PrlF toxin-antitoxin module
MASRKLVKQGRNALTLTVPAQWTRKRKLEAGDTVSVTEQGDALVIKADETGVRREIAIDLRGANRSTTWHLLQTAYIEGYDIITIQHSNPAILQEIAPHVFGTVMDELTPTRARITSIMAAPKEPIDAVLRRCGHLFVEHARAMERVANNEGSLVETKSIERMLDDNLTYCLRVLNTYERDERAYQRFLLCAWIEMGADYVSILAAEDSLTPGLAKVVREGIEAYVHGIFSDNYKSLYTKLRAMREAVPKNSFASGVAYALADMLYNNIGVFVKGDKYQQSP